MEIILKIIAVPLLFFLPGWITLFAFGGGKAAIGRLQYIEVLFLRTLISVLVTSIFGLAIAIAVAGWFSLANLTAVVFLYSIALTLVFRRRICRIPYSEKFIDSSLVILLLIAIAAGVLYFRPFEHILGGRDPGVYVNTGVNIANTGALKIYDPLLDSIDPADQRPFYHIRNGLLQKYSAFPVDDPAKGTISPYFYHMYPTWIAIFTVLFGIKGSLYVNAAFGILSLIAVYLLSKRLFDPAVGILAALILSINIAQVWLARYPTTEIFCQFLIMSGLYTTALFTKERGKLYGVIGALSFGTAFLTRFDVLLLLPPIFALFYCRSYKRIETRDLFFIVPFALLMLLGIVYDWTIARKPTMVILASFKSIMSATSLLTLAVSAVALLGAIRLVPGKIKSIVSGLFCDRRWWRYLIMALIILLAIYAYFLRPHLSESENAANFVQLGWFLSPVGLALALAGVILYLHDGADRNNILFFLIAIFVSSFFIYRKMIFPQYMWAVRRFVPVVVPSLVIFGSYAIYRIGTGIKKFGKPLAVVCTVTVVAFSFIKGAQSFRHTDYKGAINFSREVSARFSGDDIIVCENDWLATPLQYFFNKKTLQVSGQKREKCAHILNVMKNWLEKGGRVYYISNGQHLVTAELDFVLVDKIKFDSSFLKGSKRFPKTIKPFAPEVKIFQIRPYEDREAANSATDVTIDIGYNAFGLGEGFSGRRTSRDENGDVCSYRWIKQEAELIIPWFGDDVSSRLVLRASSGTKDEAVTVVLKILVDGQDVGEVDVSSGFNEYEILIPGGSVQSESKHRAKLTLATSMLDEKQKETVQLDWIRIYQ
jgi:dolichyl-phosphate-mannose-protein mannosyltransferase